MNTIEKVKTEVERVLNELCNKRILGEVQSDNFSMDLFDRQFNAYPNAIIGSPSIQSDYLTNSQNQRIVSYEVVIVESRENLTAKNNAIESLMSHVLDAFDQDFTLGGNVSGGLTPTVTNAVPVVAKGGRQLVVFSIEIRAKILVNIK